MILSRTAALLSSVVRFILVRITDSPMKPIRTTTTMVGLSTMISWMSESNIAGKKYRNTSPSSQGVVSRPRVHSLESSNGNATVPPFHSHTAAARIKNEKSANTR